MWAGCGAVSDRVMKHEKCVGIITGTICGTSDHQLGTRG